MNGAPGRLGRPEAPCRPCPLCGLRTMPQRGAPPPSATRIVRCPGCGMVFVDPLPEAALSPATYGPDYYEPWQGREENARLRLWRHRLAQIEARVPTGSLLDVGCGDGLFPKVARGAGFAVDAIEFSPEGARRAALRLGRPVAVGDLTREPLLRGPFDIVTLWHVLEHLPDPAAMLSAVRARLRPGGLLAVAVPNLDNLPMRIAYRLARLRALPLYEENAREPHLSHFSPGTLTDILQRRGFGSVEIRGDRCALTAGKRAVDVAAALLSRLCGRHLTDAIVAFARAPE